MISKIYIVNKTMLFRNVL